MNYQVKHKDWKGKKVKVIHINFAKMFKEREEEVYSLTVVADGSELEESVVKLHNDFCDGYVEDDLEVVLDMYDEILVDELGKTDMVKMNIELKEGSEIVTQAPYRIPGRLKEGVMLVLEKLKLAGIIVESESEWSSPLVPVPKPDGTVHVCVDYWRLNTLTQVHSLIPNLDDILEQAGQAQVHSKLDLSKGFYQVAVSDSSSELTTFVSPLGKYTFKSMPFGLNNATATFQHLLSKVLAKCGGFASAYIDDVLIYSNLGHIKVVLSVLKEAGLTAKPSKCQWARKHLIYLGHRIGGGQLSVPEHRVQCMVDYKWPKTRKDLLAFLGDVGYYRRFIKDFANYSAVLSPYTSSKAPVVITWTPRMLEAFQSLRVSLCNHCILNTPSVMIYMSCIQMPQN